MLLNFNRPARKVTWEKTGSILPGLEIVFEYFLFKFFDGLKISLYSLFCDEQ